MSSDKLKLQLITFNQAIITLKSAIDKSIQKGNKEDFEYFRDSVIKRFEYTYELAWKLIKLILTEKEKSECYSPKSCIKLFFKY